MDYLTHRRNLKLGLITKPEKDQKGIAKESEKKKAENIAMKPHQQKLNDWFDARRMELIGVCQCGCGRPTSKNDDQYFKCSICHIFPKKIFKSIALQPVNFVERNFWDGCHNNMDNTSIDRWPAMADWEDIKERFHLLCPLIPAKEKSHTFFTMLEKLVNEN